MKFTAITLFPQMIEAFCGQGLLGQARERGLVGVETLNPREFTEDVHHTVDDRVFGGSDGMVMKVEPLARAVESLKRKGPVKVVVLSPQGRPWTQSQAREWAAEGGHVALICGRYAGIDHRFTVTYADEEISLGDFILNGGELAAAAIIESVSRLIPGVLGNSRSPERDSFSDDGAALECPQFTRPREAAGLPVPTPLLSGHHAEIAKFEAAVGLVRTALARPDLLPPTGIELRSAAKLTIQTMDEACQRLLALEDSELAALGLKRSGSKLELLAMSDRQESVNHV